MNQRIKRSSRKNNDTSFSAMATGGFVSQQSANKEPIVRVPQKATGDIKDGVPPGLAKASPFFKQLDEKKPETKEQEAKAIAEATEKVEEDKNKEEE